MSNATIRGENGFSAVRRSTYACRGTGYLPYFATVLSWRATIVIWLLSLHGAFVMNVSYVDACRVGSNRWALYERAPRRIPITARAARMARWRCRRLENTLPPSAHGLNARRSGRPSC